MSEKAIQWEDEIYDFVIIGSGMAGLCCAYILSKHGNKVIVLEKNNEIGGSLQVFSRDKCIFDTGVHYLGALDEGQSLNQIFKYLGILDKLKLERMDENGFDRIHFFQEDFTYNYGMGYDNFVRILANRFPDNVDEIKKFTEAIKSTAEKIPITKLDAVDANYILGVDITLSTKDFIENLTENHRLRQVLAGTRLLYGGSPKTPFYLHALILDSNIQSAWRCVDGASQISREIAKSIRQYGGVIKKKCQVIGANYNSKGEISDVLLHSGVKIKGKNFISNTHPLPTIKIFGEDHFSKAYVDRINSLENTFSVFCLHLVFKEETFEYMNYNIFHFNEENAWEKESTNSSDWPQTFFFTLPVSSKQGRYAKGATVIVRMDYEDTIKWKNTFNTTTSPTGRGADYEEFKILKSEKVLDAVERTFPDIRSKIKSYSSSTPLTIRDYIGSHNGSAYGILKSVDNPLQSLISPKTNISNLFLTGQNIGMHGIFGVSISAIQTCYNFIDRETLMNEIKNA